MVVSMLREKEVVLSSSSSSHQLKNNYPNRADHHFQSTSCQTRLSPSPSAPATFFIPIFPVGFPTGVLYFNDKFSPQRHTQHQVFWGFSSEYFSFFKAFFTFYIYLAVPRGIFDLNCNMQIFYFVD